MSDELAQDRALVDQINFAADCLEGDDALYDTLRAAVSALSRRLTEAEQLRDVAKAVTYAMSCGCFFPLPDPKPGASVEALTQWGAMKNLHDKVAALRLPTGATMKEDA